MHQFFHLDPNPYADVLSWSFLSIYMPLVDRLSRRTLLLASTIAQVAAFLPFVFFKVSLAWALLNVILFGLGAGIGQQSLFQLWSGELFPTLLRSTAQGVSSASASAAGACCCRRCRTPVSGC